MKPRGGGSIVNIASVTAWHPERNLGLYSTLKTALIGLSRAFALEYGEFGIRVNTVLPRLIETKLADAFDAKTKARLVSRLPARRLGRVEDIGDAILYLCAPTGSFATGASLNVDGGLTLSLVV